MWAIVRGTSSKGLRVEPTKNRRGWRTIRIFVSSTFKGSQAERDILEKEVFPDLRLWCEHRKLRLVECDLIWGVPRDGTGGETINISLSELDRCYEDNVVPFFINLASEQEGWSPDFSDLTCNLASQYGWAYGLASNEVETVHAAFTNLNPNALFVRKRRANGIPAELKPNTNEDDLYSTDKLKHLKNSISTPMLESNVCHYNSSSSVSETEAARLDRVNRSANHDEIQRDLDEDSNFSKSVYEFFQRRLSLLFPLDLRPKEPLQVQRDAHETFLDSRSQSVLGRDAILNQIRSYILHDKSYSPLLVIGTAGAGKSAVMAKCAADAAGMAERGEIPPPVVWSPVDHPDHSHQTPLLQSTADVSVDDKWRVFFHFVGATPGSTDLAFFLQRLTREVKPHLHDIVSDLETLIQLTNSLLANANTQPILLFIDAINQIDEDKQQFLNRWIPERLSPNVRIIISTIEGTASHQIMRKFKPSPKEIVCGALDEISRTEIATNILRIYNKQLASVHLKHLVSKQGASNPLWLTLACQEVRAVRSQEEIEEKIAQLPEDLIELEMAVFSRFEQETGGSLMTATLCLLETSRHGLLETELLALLGNKENSTCPMFTGNEQELVTSSANQTSATAAQATGNDEVDKLTERFTGLISDAYVVKEGDAEKKEGKSERKKKPVQLLAAREWAVIYRNLKSLLRPCGDLGEGRLDFYHRSLSKAVRRKYFTGSDEYKKHVYNFWHGSLASYFEGVDDMDRKAEELPYHLEQLLDNNRLVRCLLEWPVFERLYSDDFSIDLLHSWLKAGGYLVAAALYKESLTVFKNSGASLQDYGEKQEKVATFIIQAGQYEDAYTLLEERVATEIEQLGSRPAKLADIYQLMAKSKSEMVKNHNFVTSAQLQEDIEVVQLCRESIKYRSTLVGEDHEFQRAMLNVLMCHHLSILADLEHKEEHRIEAFKIIDEATIVFERIGDIGHLSESIMTKSFVHPRHGRYFEEKEQQLARSMAMCQQAYGENHLLFTRLCLNTGILHEDNSDLQTAYDWFVKWDKSCKAVLGANHPKSIRARDTLNEPSYVRIRQQRERQAAGTA